MRDCVNTNNCEEVWGTTVGGRWWRWWMSAVTVWTRCSSGCYSLVYKSSLSEIETYHSLEALVNIVPCSHTRSKDHKRMQKKKKLDWCRRINVYTTSSYPCLSPPQSQPFALLLCSASPTVTLLLSLPSYTQESLPVMQRLAHVVTWRLYFLIGMSTSLEIGSKCHRGWIFTTKNRWKGSQVTHHSPIFP